MLNGRLFPVAEASSKKVAKKDAAAATLRVLIEDMQGGAGSKDKDGTASLNQGMGHLADTGVSCEVNWSPTSSDLKKYALSLKYVPIFKQDPFFLRKVKASIA